VEAGEQRMSDKNQARRTDIKVAFNGADISKSLRENLLSMTYTDNSEDESDDLQIQIEDRDGVWLKNWLDKVVQAAAAPPSTALAASGGELWAKISCNGGTAFVCAKYLNPAAVGMSTVTPSIGLNVRTGPSTSFNKVSALVCGASVTVLELVSESNEVPPPAQKSTENAVKGIKINASIIAVNYKNDDGKDVELDCGEFELDSIQTKGAPSVITIKAVSLPFGAQIRQTLKNKAWERYKLSAIAAEMAAANGMTSMYESANNPYYERAEQSRQSDIAFLQKLCKDAGISLKASGGAIVLFDQSAYEKLPTVRTFKFGDGSYNSYSFQTGTANVKYASCRVRYTNPATGALIEGAAYEEDYNEEAENNQQLEVWAKVNSAGEAQTLAAKRLRLHNKFEKSGTLTMPLDLSLVGGVTVQVSDWGLFSGKYFVQSARHSIDSKGGVTQISVRRVLEGY
jgi:phage protein D